MQQIPPAMNTTITGADTIEITEAAAKSHSIKKLRCKFSHLSRMKATLQLTRSSC
jgi:biotin synthase-related radical SAM superfamily protein